MKKKTVFLLLFTVLCAGAAGYAYYNYSAVSTAQIDAVPADTFTPSVVVETIRPSESEITRDTQFIGRVEPGQQVAVLPRTTGEVKILNYNVGDRVEKGALLLQIDTTDIELQVNISEAAYEAAKLQAEMSVSNVKDSQIMQLESAYAAAKLAYESAVKLADLAEDTTDDKIDSFSDTTHQLGNSMSQVQASIKVLEAKIAYRQGLHSRYYGTNGYANSDATAITARITELEGLISSSAAGSVERSNYDYELEFLNNPVSETEFLSGISALETQLDTAKGTYNTLVSGYNTASASYDSLVDGRKLDRTQTSNALAAARLNMENAERALNLAKEKSLPMSEKLAAAGVEQAEAALASARRQLDYAVVTAPISGIIERRDVTLNSIASPSSPAFIISNKDMMVVSFSVPERVLNNLSLGDSVSIERSGNTVTGEITELSTMVGNDGGLFKVKATLPSSSINLLTGTTVTIGVQTDRSTSGIVLPIDCVYFDNNEAFVYTVVNGIAKKTPVVTGISNNENIEIVSGISTQDEVVSTWHSRLAEGAELTIANTASN